MSKQTKIYVAGRAKTRLGDVKQIQRKLISEGHLIIYDWASGDSSIKKPYRDPANRKHNQAAQSKMLKSAAKADVFILLDEPGMRGAYVELGAFLLECVDNPKNKKVYIVGPESHERQFVFESPDFVYFVNSIEDVIEDLKN